MKQFRYFQLGNSFGVLIINGRETIGLFNLVKKNKNNTTWKFSKLGTVPIGAIFFENENDAATIVPKKIFDALKLSNSLTFAILHIRS